MNLIEFAVQRKLEAGDSLLSYVTDGRDIPVEVIAESFKELIAPLEDARSSHLVNDYIGMLQAYVPTTQVLDPITGEVNVSGEIPFDLMESIMMVHRVEQEAIVSKMVSATVSALSQKPAEVKHLDLQMLEQAINVMNESMPKVEAIGGYEMVEPEEELFADVPVVGYDDIKDLLEESGAILPQEDAVAPVEEIITQPVEEEFVQPIVEPIEDVKVMPVEEQPYTEEVITEMIHEEVAEEPEMDIPAVAKRIYNKLVKDLQEKGLVDSLNLDVGIVL